MFEIDVYGEIHKAVFRYFGDEHFDNVPKDDVCGKWRDGVECHISVLNEAETMLEPEGRKVWNRMFVGTAVLRPGEQNVKNTGRKVALTNALALSGFNREIRTAFWNKYLKMTGCVTS